MNFKVANVLYSFISLIVALFFVFIGLVSFMLPWFPGVRMMLAGFVMEDSIMIFLFGFCFLVVGISFIAGIFWGSRRQYYHLKSGPFAVTISESLFQDYLNNYWQQIFPNAEVPSSVRLAKNRIHITADLPFVPLAEQKKIVKQMQEDVTDIFSRLIGYKAEYVFSVSFREEQVPTKV